MSILPTQLEADGIVAQLKSIRPKNQHDSYMPILVGLKSLSFPIRIIKLPMTVLMQLCKTACL